MMSAALLYFITSMVALVGPIMLLFKKKITNPQWIYAFYQILLSFAIALYAAYFSPFLRGEYIMSILFATFTLLLPIIYYLYVCKLSVTMGVAVSNRRYFLIPILTIGLMLVVAFIAGRGDYREYLEQAVYGNNIGFTDSLLYNILLFVNYYMFLIVIILEVFIVASYSIKHLISYSKMLDHYGVNEHPIIHSKALIIVFHTISVVIAILAIWMIIFSFYSRVLTIIIVSLLCLSNIYSAIYCYCIKYSVEDLFQMAEVNEKSEITLGKDKKSKEEVLLMMQERLIDYVENKEAYCNTDLSMYRLADYLRVTPTDVVLIVRNIKGCSYAEYIDGLRINKAINMILHRCSTELGDIDRTKITSMKEIEDISQQCGYHSLSAFYTGFNHIIGQSFFNWFTK